MSETTRAAVRAYYRLHKATEAVASDPEHPGALESLTAAATEANGALRAAGLLGRSRSDMAELVRAEFPTFKG